MKDHIFKSKGHYFFDHDNQREFIHDSQGNLYAAETWRPLATDGYRLGARFECAPRPDKHVKYIREVFGIDLEKSWERTE